MKNSDYVIINNRAYDPITGLPVDGVEIERPKEITKPQIVSERIQRGVEMPSIHKTVQHSSTLSRRYVKKPTVIPTAEQANNQPIVAAYSPMSLQQFTVEKVESVHKFAQPKAQTQRADMPAQAHPVTHRAAGRTLDITAPRRQRVSTKQKLDTRVSNMAASSVAKPAESKELKPAHVLKNEAIYEALSKEVAPQKKTRAKKQRSSSRWGRFASLATASLAIVMLAGYFTYLNMPNLSIRMAAVQSGVDAKYPGYSPDGYALNGPITFKEGEVGMKFAYADGSKNFTITQQRSNWDSSAVREFVNDRSQDATTTQVDGLTIYTYNGNAAWVNGGILYTLEGNAPLSSNQIQRIATSL